MSFPAHTLLRRNLKILMALQDGVELQVCRTDMGIFQSDPWRHLQHCPRRFRSG